jgi:hypothetical protein
MVNDGTLVARRRRTPRFGEPSSAYFIETGESESLGRRSFENSRCGSCFLVMTPCQGPGLARFRNLRPLEAPDERVQCSPSPKTKPGFISSSESSTDPGDLNPRNHCPRLRDLTLTHPSHHRTPGNAARRGLFSHRHVSNWNRWVSSGVGSSFPGLGWPESPTLHES